MNTAPLQAPMKLKLDELFEQGGFQQENLDIRLKKSRLALQLGLLLQRLYPGPWIQQNWTTEVIQTLGSVSSKHRVAPDLSRVGIPCDLLIDWEATNTAWLEFVDAQDFKKIFFCRFFLFFAQLLVDISDGCSNIRSASVEDDATWYNELLENASQLQDNKLLHWYGRAVEGCAKFALDYHASFGNIENPRNRAHKVIQENIVRNLHKNMCLWEDEFDRHSRALRSETMEPDTNQVNAILPQYRGKARTSDAVPMPASIVTEQNAIPKKFFTLFSGVDKESIERQDPSAFHLYSQSFTHSEA